MKRILSLFMLFTLVLALVSCSAVETDETTAPVETEASTSPTETPPDISGTSRIPTLCITASDVTLDLWFHCGSWHEETEDGMGTGINVDANAPYDCVDSLKRLTLAKFPSFATFSFSAKEKPSKLTLIAYLIDKDGKVTNDGTEMAPTADMTYLLSANILYVVEAEWGINSRVIYAFVTEIK